LRRPHLLKCGRIVVYASILVAAFQGIALGAGLELYPTDFGTASAGEAAIAQDASTAASNPGILLIPIPKLRIGLIYESPEYFNFGFRPFLTGLGPGLKAISKRIGGAQFSVPLTEAAASDGERTLRGHTQPQSDGQRWMAELD
jgi:hypothetical protein